MNNFSLSKQFNIYMNVYNMTIVMYILTIYTLNCVHYTQSRAHAHRRNVV